MEVSRRLILSTIAIDENARSRLVEALGSAWEYRMEGGDVGNSVLEEVEVLLVGGGRGWFTKEKLHSMRKLRMIQTFSAGVDQLDLAIIPAAVTVCSNAGAFGGPIAEFVLGAVISLGRNLAAHDKDLREGKFVQSPPGLYLKGRTIGILGTGGIGQSVARLAKCLGMRTLGVNTTGSAVPSFDEVAKLDGLGALLRQSDVIVVALPLTLKTRTLLGHDQFQLMKPECIIVNVARGAIINQEALYEFLRDHPRAKAALDVWWSYPSKPGAAFAQEYPISALPNVLSSPHFSDGTEEQLKHGSDDAVANVLRYVREQPLKGVVRREDYLSV